MKEFKKILCSCRKYYIGQTERKTFHFKINPFLSVKRPNLGCRVLVQRNVGKLAPALASELSSWQADVRVRCGQLLCAIALHAEGCLTQHLQNLLPAMYMAARDEDQRVVVNVSTK